MYAWDQFFALSMTLIALVSPAISNQTGASQQIMAMGMTQQVNGLPPFKSVELRNGGKVFVRQGPTQSVTIVKGEPSCARITVEKQTRLVIDHQRKCASGVRLEVEVVVTSLDAVAVSNGGTLQSVGRFAQQSELAVAVISGGMIDIRSMTVQNVTAAVISGGRIFTKPQNSLVASVSDGGAITYWGGPSITKSVTHGGVVTQGDPADADKPLSESNHANPAVPAVPPVRAVSSVPQ